jgi:hypothetical protein
MEQHSVYNCCDRKKLMECVARQFGAKKNSQKCHFDNDSDAVLNHPSWKIVKLDDVANNLNFGNRH